MGRQSSIPDTTDRKAVTRVAVVSVDTRDPRVQEAVPGGRSTRGGRPPEPLEALIVEASTVEDSEATGQGREAAGVRSAPRGRFQLGALVGATPASRVCLT